MVKQRQPRRRMARGPPHLYVREDVALATADTVSTTILYATSTSSTTLTKPTTFSLGPVRVSAKYGSAETTVFCVVRKLPEGYTAPAITPTDGNTTFVDMPNVLAYGMIRVGSTDTMNRIDLRKLRTSVMLAQGDSVILQVVTNAASTNQAYSALAEYNIL